MVEITEFDGTPIPNPNYSIHDHKKFLSYHIDPKIKVKWDTLRQGKLQKKDEDRCYIVDGRERVGKSLFALQQAKYLDPTFNIDRICFTPEEFLEQIRNAPEGSCVIFDEAFRGLSSKGSQSKINKQIVQAMMEMGQRNLIIFIVLPTIFLLELYAAVLRSNALFHISKKKGANARSFKMYSHKKKAKLYQLGIRKGWEYKVYTAFMGRFPNKYPGGKKFELKYREKKRLAGIGNDAGAKEEIKDKITDQRDRMVVEKHKELKSLRKTAEYYSNVWKESVSHVTIKNIIDKFKETAQPSSETNGIQALT